MTDLFDTLDDSQSVRPVRGVVHAPHLVVLFECDRPLSGCARYSLEGVDRVLIGRGDERAALRSSDRTVRTLHVKVPGRSMSATHARLVRVGAEWALEDLGSTNGTFLNGERITRAVLADGDVWDLGHTLFRVQSSLAIPADGPCDVDLRPSADGAPRTLDPDFAAQLETAARLAPSKVPLLVVGESGVGKEIFARWVHGLTRRRGDFVAVNCGAIPDTLVESQMFGHVKGAFSGAVRDHAGFVRSAEGGTLFLDEIADLPKTSQAALLRVLQEREVVPVGATRPERVDMRLVSATHECLESMTARGEFRHDLFARVAGAIITLPALRQRRDDLGVLVATLFPQVSPEAACQATFAPAAARALFAYDWPLNVRELGQALATAGALAQGGRVEPCHLPPKVARSLDRSAAPPPPSSGGGECAARSLPPGALDAYDDRLRLELLEQLARHDGNITHVARALGKARMQVQRWCRRFGIDPRAYRAR